MTDISQERYRWFEISAVGSLTEDSTEDDPHLFDLREVRLEVSSVCRHQNKVVDFERIRTSGRPTKKLKRLKHCVFRLPARSSVIARAT